MLSLLAIKVSVLLSSKSSESRPLSGGCGSSSFSNMEKRMTRKVVTRTPHREVGVVNPSWLLQHPVEHESHLEKRFILVALSCPIVTDIIHQPMTLELIYGDDQVEKYTPDFKVAFANGDSVIIEVKPEKYVSEHARKLTAARQQLASSGDKFEIVTENHIDANGLSARALLLMRYGRLWLDPDEAMACKRLLEERFAGSARVHDLVSHGISEALIWNLVANHDLKVPIGLRVDLDSTVAINDFAGDHHDYFRSWFGLTSR